MESITDILVLLVLNQLACGESNVGTHLRKRHCNNMTCRYLPASKVRCHPVYLNNFQVVVETSRIQLRWEIGIRGERINSSSLHIEVALHCKHDRVVGLEDVFNGTRYRPISFIAMSIKIYKAISKVGGRSGEHDAVPLESRLHDDFAFPDQWLKIGRYQNLRFRLMTMDPIQNSFIGLIVNARVVIRFRGIRFIEKRFTFLDGRWAIWP